MEQKLDPEFKKRWVEALRSGEYAQCVSGEMWNTGTYCCLAVAAELCGYKFGDKSETRSAYTDVLPTAINGGFENPTVCHLVRLNDDHRMPFPKIAEWIESNL